MKVLVLSGGGAKGAYQVGALSHLLTTQRFDAVVGVSVGALNAAGLSFLGIERLKQVWFGIKSTDEIVSENSWLSILLLKKRGYYSIEPLRKKLKQNLPAKGSPVMPTYFGYCDLRDTKVIYEAAGEDMDRNIRAILASSAMPAIMEPVEYDFVDGGIRDVIPLGFAIKHLLADEITVVSASPIGRELPKTWKPGHIKIIGHAFRAVDTMSSEIAYNDLCMCRDRNELPNYRKVSVKVYAPSYPSVIDTLQFEPKAIREAYDQGVRMAQTPVMEF